MTHSHPPSMRAQEKLKRIPVTPLKPEAKLAKPRWLRKRISHGPQVKQMMHTLRQHQLSTVCEEASCPNLHECFNSGTATFMIMGDLCTRRCRFCDVAHGRPKPLNPKEPEALASAVQDLGLSYVVITSVNRDDLPDGGGEHFKHCIQAIRRSQAQVQIEILTPDFRGRGKLARALEQLSLSPPDVFNHNIETVFRLSKQIRTGACPQHSLKLLQQFKTNHPNIPTKSGLMLGMGETTEEVVEVMHALRAHQVDRLTLGQYLAPSSHHHPVERYLTPNEFETLKQTAESLGFSQVTSGPLVRSSYHAAEQHAEGEI